MNIEQDSFELILHSGNARFLAYEALSFIKSKKDVEAKEKLENAKNELLLAQRKHAEMLRQLANNEQTEINLLLIHAEDHVASSEIALDMAKEIVGLYEIINKAGLNE